MKSADVIATIYFLKTEEGGRAGPTPIKQFRCALKFEGELFDSMLFLDHVGRVAPGQTVQVPIIFLCPDLIKPRLKQGSIFMMWEIRDIARGTVDEVVWDTPMNLTNPQL